jgi:DNA-binding XRE family transcriptional regulator
VFTTKRLRPNKKELEEFGDAVRERRMAIKISQAELAKAVKADITTINGIELGRCGPSLKLYFNVCRALWMPKPPFCPDESWPEGRA